MITCYKMQAERLVAYQHICEDMLDEVVVLLCKEDARHLMAETYQHMEYLRLIIASL